MAYFHLLINGVVEDEFDGKPRIRADVVEVKPREYKMNLSKADAAIINQLKSLVGHTAMVPARDGMMNGQAFLALQPGEIIPLVGAQPISSVNPAKELDSANEKSRPLGVPTAAKNA
jgi:hypothetical protein